MTVRRYEQNGITYEVRNTCYVRYDGTPCKQLDLRGPIGDFLSETSEVIQVAELEEGWTRYWIIDTDPEGQQTIVDLVEAYSG